jgi:hypothetical protein
MSVSNETGADRAGHPVNCGGLGCGFLPCICEPLTEVEIAQANRESAERFESSNRQTDTAEMSSEPKADRAQREAWDEMVRAVHAWASHYMDQFETFCFLTTPTDQTVQRLPTYVTITHVVADPDDPKWGVSQV